MASPDTLLSFDDFTVDLVRRRCSRRGQPLSLTPKAFDTLAHLISNPGQTVLKRELMDVVWGDVAVEENNLTQQIAALRRALGEVPGDHRFIVTVPGRGYSFVAPVHANTPAAEPAKRRRFARLDRGALRGYAVAIAYILLIAASFLISGTRGTQRPQSLAVLDFETASAGDEFLGTAISDTLRARLGSVGDLVVRPRPAAIDEGDTAAGRKLGVDAVVSGSVQRDGGRIRVAVRMIDVSADRIVWGKTFDESGSDVFALQDAIANEVARVLHLETSAATLPRLIPGSAV